MEIDTFFYICSSRFHMLTFRLSMDSQISYFISLCRKPCNLSGKKSIRRHFITAGSIQHSLPHRNRKHLQYCQQHLSRLIFAMLLFPANLLSSHTHSLISFWSISSAKWSIWICMLFCDFESLQKTHRYAYVEDLRK